MVSSEQAVKIFQATWWSEEVHKAHLLVKYWKIVISQQRNDMQDDEVLTEIKEKVGLEYNIFQGDPLRKHSNQLRKATKH
eukprot:15339346-Ditylum_brightwellii.AAC.2